LRTDKSLGWAQGGSAACQFSVTSMLRRADPGVCEPEPEDRELEAFD